MVIAVGVDVVDVDRFSRSLTRTPALNARLFGELDREGIGEGDAGVLSLAARFAAKEATLKALGGNISGFAWHDIQVRRPVGQPPVLELAGGAKQRAEEKGIDRWHLSLSHDAGVAVAFVIAESFSEGATHA